MPVELKLIPKEKGRYFFTVLKKKKKKKKEKKHLAQKGKGFYPTFGVLQSSLWQNEGWGKV